MVKKISKKNAHQMCRDIKKHVEENHELPSRLTYDGTTYYVLEFAFAMSYILYHLKSEFTIPNFQWCDNPNGKSINKDIPIDECKNQCKRVYNHILKNNQVPSSVLVYTDNKKNYTFIDIRHWIYYISKIVVFYDEHNQTLPTSCKYDNSIFIKPQPKPQPTFKKYGHSTECCCENRGQNNDVYCAPHSMQEIIRNLTGKVILQDTLASWAGTTSGGTGHSGIETAIAKAAKTLGVNLSCKWYNFSELGWDGINKILQSNNQDCIIHNLYRYNPGVHEGWGHYEVINSISGSNVKVQNSLGDICSRGCYCGYVENRSTSTFRTYISGISQKSVLVVTRS